MHDAIRFGRFEVRPGERLLLADGQPVPLGGRAFDLLLVLIEQRDRVVTKDELLDRVWPGLVVEENNLQVQVSTLRKLLGADSIKTVPGRGYRFAQTVSRVGPAPAQPLPTVGPAPARPGLPQRPLSLLGRDDEVAALLARLDAHPLVTLVGAGGIGKTTLARAALAARQTAWRDGVAWVDLAALNDAALIAGAVAQALALPLAAQAEPLAALVEAARPLQLLLVLDNAEHLLDGVAGVAHALLQGTPGLRLLVTSQAPLRLAGEQVLRLDALAVPAAAGAAATALRSGAVALFAQRAAAADRRFVLDDANVVAVVEICRRLDGLPLALELAAARVPLLGLRGVAERLDERFKLLAGGSRSAPTRQQTLQAALAWSLALLPALERSVFERLAVFAGGFTLELARDALAGDGLDEWTLIEALANLADRSLLGVAIEAGDGTRYTLTETARAYAMERLARDQAVHAVVCARHAQALRRWFDAAPADWLRLTDADWLARYEPELGNLRAALQWAEGHDAETLLALVGAAAPLWHHLSLHAEARRWHEISEARIVADAPPALAARWWRAAQWAWAGVAPQRAHAAALQAESLYRALGDTHGLYAQLTGAAGLWREVSVEASAALDEALALECPEWPPRERAWGQRARADVARAQGRLATSRSARQAELALRIAAGDERGRMRALSHLVDVSLALGDPDEAVRLGRELVERLRGRRDAAMLFAELLKLMQALLAQGDAQGAAELLPQARALAEGAGQDAPLAEVTALLAATGRGS
jgi:predicted ATPase/DNA-binding winged helix-turn-helix (wHTH) protein